MSNLRLHLWRFRAENSRIRLDIRHGTDDAKGGPPKNVCFESFLLWLFGNFLFLADGGCSSSLHPLILRKQRLKCSFYSILFYPLTGSFFSFLFS
ncbi:hypothetical protein V8C34DRAFT_274344 [Trichoderma compactum]